MLENIAVPHDEMEHVPEVVETITYTKLDGTEVTCDADHLNNVLNIWLYERVLMDPETTFDDRRLASKFKFLVTNSGVMSRATVEDPRQNEFKAVWEKFLADPNVKITK